MKVAVISLVPTLGKTAYISVLAGVFARSQRKNVAILSTGNGAENVDIVDVKIKREDLSNPYVFKSILDSSDNDDKDLLNYGLRQGDEPVFIYDIMNTSMDANDKEEFFIECVQKIPADLTLIEICGDYKSEYNQRIIKACDCYIVMTECSKKCIKLTKEFMEANTKDFLLKCAFLVSKYVPDVISEKALAKELGINVADLFFFPYVPTVARRMLEESLDKIAYDIIKGEPSVVMLRSRLMEIMSWMYDTPKRKIVRSIDKWYK